MQKSTIALAITAAAFAWVYVSAQQEMSPRPGPGSGITNVTGSVNIANAPNVRAAQDGEWRVAIGNTPTVRVTELPPLTFLRTGGRYEVTWADGTIDTVTVVSLASNGWIEVDRSRRWINLSSARSIAEHRP